MKQIIFSIFIIAFILSGCQDEQHTVFQETGVVIDYGGSGNCGFVIELDNGSRIQPLNYPQDFSFAQGQRVFVEYTEIPYVIPSCDQGKATDISYIEETGCEPYIDLYPDNYDSLANDAVNVYEAYVDGNYLYLKLSYSGGCREHTIKLARINKSNPAQDNIPVLEIRHNANEDLCEALITKEYMFDLTPLIMEGATQFRLKVKGYNGDNYNEILNLENSN